MSQQQERQAFLGALAVSPYDVALRRRFADWLSDHGYDDEAAVQYAWTAEKQRAEDWMREMATRHQHADHYGAGDGILKEALEWSGGKWDTPEVREVLDRLDELQGWRTVTYEELIQAGHDYLDHEDGFCQTGSDTLRDAPSPEYWRNWSIITGRAVDGTPGVPFRCGC